MNFYARMGVVCRRIPEGRVAAYGQIARLCGFPRNARQVGYGLREDLAGPGIPAHRIVNSRGELSGAGHFLTWDLQKELLLAEGVRLEQGRDGWAVVMAEYQWRPTEDELEEMQKEFGEA